MQGQFVASPVGCAGDGEVDRGFGARRQHAGGVADRLRVESIAHPQGEAAGPVDDGGFGPVGQGNPENERVLGIEAERGGDAADDTRRFHVPVQTGERRADQAVVRAELAGRVTPHAEDRVVQGGIGEAGKKFTNRINYIDDQKFFKSSLEKLVEE